MEGEHRRYTIQIGVTDVERDYWKGKPPLDTPEGAWLKRPEKDEDIDRKRLPHVRRSTTIIPGVTIFEYSNFAWRPSEEWEVIAQ